MANPWIAFEELLPKSVRWLGKITALSNGKATVVPPTGVSTSFPAVIVDIGDGYNIDDYVFVEDGVVVSKAPNIRAAYQETVY